MTRICVNDAIRVVVSCCDPKALVFVITRSRVSLCHSLRTVHVPLLLLLNEE
jgi:hypothetical protein